MSDEKFKLPRSSYEELVKIIKTYGQFEDPKSLDDVSKLIGMSTTVISSNNAFLTQIDVIESGQKKIATIKGKELARALEHEMPNEIRKSWRKIVVECAFLQNLVSAIKIRKGMDESTLVSHIAYSAGEPKKPFVMTGARAVVDILRAAEVIKDLDGKYVVNRDDYDDDNQFPDSQNTTQITIHKNNPSLDSVINKTISEQVIYKEKQTSIMIRVDIKVECKLSELEELGSKINNLLSVIKTQDTPENL